MNPTPDFCSVPTEAEIEATIALDMPGGRFCAAAGPGEQFGFIWTEEAEARTGRDLWDLFDRPGPPIQYGDLWVSGEAFSLPFAAFARAFPEVQSSGGMQDSAGRCERDIRVLWERLWSQPEAPLPFIASVLMVLVVATEPYLRPRYSTHTFEDGSKQELEWGGRHNFHQAANHLWRDVLDGALGAAVIDRYDVLCEEYPVPPPLAACQKSLLAWALGEREHLLQQAKRAEAQWHRAEGIARQDLLLEENGYAVILKPIMRWLRELRLDGYSFEKAAEEIGERMEENYGALLRNRGLAPAQFSARRLKDLRDRAKQLSLDLNGEGSDEIG